MLELAAEASFVPDWRQTQAAIDNPHMHEWNPIIGRDGQNISPDAYFLTLGLLHPLIAAALPPRLRLAFQLATIGAQGYRVYDNHETFVENRTVWATAASSR